jgi:tRNA isopentenyl-2-thiomethyl-A-37 hydroxylase MiaE
MVCGKGRDNMPLQEFILQSPAPIETAVKLSSLYRDLSEKEKERAKDLHNVSVYAENMAVELLSISASEYNAALLLKSFDHRGKPLLDVLIENEQVWRNFEKIALLKLGKYANFTKMEKFWYLNLPRKNVNSLFWPLVN